MLNKSRTLLNKLLKHSLHHKPPIFLKVNKYTPTKLVSWSTAQLIFYARICARTNGAQFMCRRMSTFSTRVHGPSRAGSHWASSHFRQWIDVYSHCDVQLHEVRRGVAYSRQESYHCRQWAYGAIDPPSGHFPGTPDGRWKGV